MRPLPPSLLWGFLLSLTLGGCGIFEARTPELPATESGTFTQPDTPEQVIDNLQAAVAELNVLNYRRSLADDLQFTPTATAQASDPVFSSWSQAEEEQYFSTLAAAAQLGSGHNLQLNNETLTIVTVTENVFDATYVLTVNHNRPDVPTLVQGRLLWTLVQDPDGLWRLSNWTDQELGNEPSWSTLKADFVK